MRRLATYIGAGLVAVAPNGPHHRGSVIAALPPEGFEAGVSR